MGGLGNAIILGDVVGCDSVDDLGWVGGVVVAFVGEGCDSGVYAGTVGEKKGSRSEVKRGKGVA